MLSPSFQSIVNIGFYRVNPKKKKVMIFEKKYSKSTLNLRWLEPIYVRVGYVFDLRFSE